MEEEKLLTLKEVCAILNMKPQAVRKMYLNQGLPVVRFSKNNVKFKESDIHNWVESHYVKYEPKD
jgi:excisionase family DNA binding protein